MTSLRRRFRNGIVWTAAVTAFNQGSTFVLNIVVANLLGKLVFGQFAMIQSSIALLNNCAQLATGSTATKYVAELRSVDQMRTAGVIRLCSTISKITATVAALLLLLGAPWIASHALHAPQLATFLMLGAGIVFFTVMNGYQIGALAGFESYPALAAMGGIGAVVLLALGSAGAVLAGVPGVLAGLLVAAALRWFLGGRLLQSACNTHQVFLDGADPWRQRSILFQFTLPGALCGLSTMPALWLSNVFLVRQPNGYEQMALLSVAFSFKTVLVTLVAMINTVTASLINHQLGLARNAQYRRLFWTNMALTCGLLACSVPLTILCGPIVLQVFGKHFTNAYPVLVVMMLAVIPESLAIAAYQVVQSKAQMWQSLLAITLPRDATIAAAAYFLAPHYGAAGVAWSYVIGLSLAFVSTTAVVARLGLGVAALPPRGTIAVARPHLAGMNGS